MAWRQASSRRSSWGRRSSPAAGVWARRSSLGFSGDVGKSVGPTGAGEFVGQRAQLGKGFFIQAALHVSEGFGEALTEAFGQRAEDRIGGDFFGDGDVSRLAGKAGDHGQELGHIDGFGSVFITADAEAALAILGHGVGSEGDDWTRIGGLSEFSGGGVAVHDRHLHVHEDDIEGVAGAGGVHGDIDGLAAVFRGGHFAAGIAEMEHDDFAVFQAIFGEEDAGAEISLCGFGGTAGIRGDALHVTGGDQFQSPGCNPEGA